MKAVIIKIIDAKDHHRGPDINGLYIQDDFSGQIRLNFHQGNLSRTAQIVGKEFLSLVKTD